MAQNHIEFPTKICMDQSSVQKLTPINYADKIKLSIHSIVLPELILHHQVYTVKLLRYI